MEKVSKENQNQNNQAGDFEQDQKIELIPIEKIVPHPFLDTGVRNEADFNDMVEDLKIRGQNQPVVVRPKGDMYELGIGHTRWRAHKRLVELGDNRFEKIKAIISKIENDAEWAELVVTDNLRRTNYSQIQLEELTYLLWTEGTKAGRYKNPGDLAKVMQCTDTWIRIRIEARELRIKVKEVYPDVKLDNIPTQSMIDAKIIMENRGDTGFKDYARLLDLANQEDIKPKRIKQMAETLPKWPEELRKKVLFDGASFGEIEFKLKNEANSTKHNPTKKTSTKSTVETCNPKFIIETYESLNKHLKNYLTTISGKEKEKAIRYIKMMTVLLCESLLDNKEITAIHFRQISDDILGVMINPDNYDGSSDLQRLGKFLQSHAGKKEEQYNEVTSTNDPPKPGEV